MAFTNYQDYVNSLANFLVIQANDANLALALPRIIDDAEQRLYRELDLLDTVVRDSSATLTANSRNFTLPQSLGRFVITESMNVFSTPGVLTSGRRQLVPTTREAIDAIWGDEQAISTAAIPEYFAMITDQTIIVGPSPGQAYPMEVIGTIRPTPLSPTNQQTYLTLYLPDLFFAESMVIGYAYMKDFAPMADDPQSGITFETHYKTLWQSANTEETRKRYAASAWSPKQPTQLATPPRA